MKIKDALRAADDIRPNPYLPATKLAWLAELDGKVALDVMLTDISEAQHFNYTERDMDTELLVQFPHDRMYVLYLAAMMDYAADEMKKYENDMKLFNAAWGEFVRWFARTYEPAQREDECCCE